MREQLTVGILAASNLGAAVAARLSWLDMAEPYLHFLIGVGQVVVAIFTAWYIWKKIQNFPNKEKDIE